MGERQEQVAFLSSLADMRGDVPTSATLDCVFAWLCGDMARPRS
jgi:hypothetical protein